MITSGINTSSLKIVAFLVLFIPTFVLAQPKADSLRQVWKNSSLHDTVRLDALQILIWDYYLYSNTDSAFILAQQQLNFAEKRGIEKYVGVALNSQGLSFKVKGDLYKANDYLKRSLAIKEKLKDQSGAAGVLINIGHIRRNQGDFAEAAKCYSRALKITEKIGDRRFQANALESFGILNYYQGEYDLAIEYMEKSMKIQLETGDKRGVGGSLINIGSVYQGQRLFDQAKLTYDKAMKIFVEINDVEGIAMTLNNIGFVFYDKSKLDGVSGSEKQMMLDSAKNYFRKALKFYEDSGFYQGFAGTLNNIGRCYAEEGNYAQAVVHSGIALEKSKEVGAPGEIQETSQILYQSYKGIGDYKNALEMYELYIRMRDTIQREENQKEVIRQQYKYEYEKQAARDSVKTSEEKKVKDAQIAQQDAEIRAKKNQQYMLFGGLGLVLIFAVFMYNRFKVTQKQKGIIEEQKHIVEEKNKEITDSITYAKRIQTAILPPDKLVKEYLENSFILYKPKDIVAGDFYWMESVNSLPATGSSPLVLFAACDCTGHGVPGAMVSVVCNNGLNRAVREFGLTDPGKILDKTRELVIEEFQKSEEEVKDGMDISLVSLAFRSENESEERNSSLSHPALALKWAGANNPLWLIRQAKPEPSTLNFELIEYKPNKQPIGKYAGPKPFTTHDIQLQKGDAIYIFTDGFQDQFGGEKGKKLKAKAFKELLLSIQDKEMHEQKRIIDDTFEKWKDNLEQNDDVCVIGVRI